MKKIKIKILIVCLILLSTFLFACTPDPRNQAEANNIQMKAEQDNLDRIQQREQNEKEFIFSFIQKNTLNSRWIESMDLFIKFFMFGLTVAVFVTMLGLGVGGFLATQGMGRAISLFLINRAEKVYNMQPETMSFPLIPIYEGNRRLAIFNPNDGSNTLLNLANPADQQKIKGLTQQNTFIGVAHQARQHKTSPSGVSSILSGVSDLIEAPEIVRNLLDDNSDKTLNLYSD